MRKCGAFCVYQAFHIALKMGHSLSRSGGVSTLLRVATIAYKYVTEYVGETRLLETKG